MKNKLKMIKSGQFMLPLAVLRNISLIVVVVDHHELVMAGDYVQETLERW